MDFLKLVGKRIEAYGQSNIDMAEQMEKCFSSEWMRLDSFAQSYECRTTLHWINPKQFAPSEGHAPTDFSNSLFYAIDQARFNLALGSARVDPRERKPS